MHILIATDGHLDPKKATEMVTRMHRPDDMVTVLTAVEHPRQFLRSYAEETGVDEVATIAHEAGPGVLGIASGAKVAERLAPLLHHEQTEEYPAELERYFATTARRRVDHLIDLLKAQGIIAEAAWTATDHQTADSILDAAKRADADVLVVGSHGQRRFEGVLGSTVDKLLRRASIPVVVIT
ncbi:MAG: universal stress protein [Actinomycetia bacterium]|nr:universal stress protein [Actinomycetes bacterium]